ncbi:MAG: glycosyltransferase family 4 protein [Saprospiraceae bacterium]|nr:glycosyltransferase family 4 protein [Saprospiraceae bacterium]
MNRKPVHYTLWQIGPGGMELGVKYYSEHLSDIRKLYVYGIRPAGHQIFDESLIEVQSGPDGRIAPYLAYFRYCRKYRNDIFHLQNGGPLILLLTLLAGVKTIVYHIHGTIYWRTPLQEFYLKTTWRAARMLMKGARVEFIANSRYSAGIFHDKVMPVTPAVIYNGMNVGRYTGKRTLRKDLRRIGYAGRLAKGKNVHLVIRLFEQAAAKCPHVELHIAGDGSLRATLERQAAASPYADRIVFHGFIKDIAAFYASIDLFIFLSAYESFGNVIAEALLTGLPTLTSNVPVFEEIYGSKSSFILGDPKHYDTLEKKFLPLLDDFPRLAQEALDVSSSVEQQCSIEHHVSQIESIYEKN